MTQERIVSNWDDYLKLITAWYRDEPDEHIISIGDWIYAPPTEFDEVKLFRPLLQLELGELRKLDKELGSEHNIATRDTQGYWRVVNGFLEE